MNRIFVLAALALAGAPARAATDCSNAADQLAMNECAAKGAAAADADLNAVYKQLQSALKDEAPIAAKLTAAQKSWVAFRDTECAYQTAGTEDGSIHPAMVAVCDEDLTRARTAMLKSYLTCPDFSMACPAPETK